MNNSDRLWTRKIQVHPDNTNSSESERMNPNTTNLFHGNERLNSKLSLLLKTKRMSEKFFFPKESSSNLLNTRRTSNTVGICTFCKLSITSACHPSQLEVPEGEGPHTLCMIRHRNTSLPTITPTRGIKHPKSLDNSVEKLNFDRIG